MSLAQDEFDSLIATVPEYLQVVQQSSGNLAGNAGDILDLLPMSLGAKIKQLLARLHAVTKKLVALLAKPVTEPGDPFALLKAGTAWAEGVGDRVDGQVAVIDMARLDGWTGTAPVRYAPDPHRSGHGRRRDQQAHRATAGNTIITMWVGVAAAFRAATPDLAGAASAARSVVTLPAAAATAAHTLRWLVLVISAVLTAAHMRLTAATYDLARLGQPDTFLQPGGRYHWPPVRRSIAGPADWRPAQE